MYGGAYMWRFWLSLAALTGLVVVAASAPPKRKPLFGSPEYWDDYFDEMHRNIERTVDRAFEDAKEDWSVRIRWR
jgi:hypothetical protein